MLKTGLVNEKHFIINVQILLLPISFLLGSQNADSQVRTFQAGEGASLWSLISPKELERDIKEVPWWSSGLHIVNAGDLGSIPGQGTRISHVATKSLHAATKESVCCN